MNNVINLIQYCSNNIEKPECERFIDSIIHYKLPLQRKIMEKVMYKNNCIMQNLSDYRYNKLFDLIK